jgi:excisionase family DNA binding protein
MDETPAAKPKAWLSVKDAAEYLGLGRSSVYEIVAAGRLACYRIGPNRGRIRFRPADLDAYLERMKVGTKVKTQPAPPREEYVSIYDHSKPGGPLRAPIPVPKERH